MYLAVVVATQRLLVPCRAEGNMAAGPFEEKQVIVPQAALTRFVKGQDPRAPMLYLSREDHFCLVGVEEGRLAGGLGRRGAPGPYIDGSSSSQPLPQAVSRFLKLLVLRPLRTTALSRFARPLLRGCATEANQIYVSMEAQ